MMRFVVLVLLLLGAQFSATAFAPAEAGKAWLLWPFADDSKSWLGIVGGLPKQPGSVVTALLAGIATLCFLAATLGLFGIAVPADWWRPLVVVAIVASALLHVLYFGIWAIAPIAVDAILVWGIATQNWSVSGLGG